MIPPVCYNFVLFYISPVFAPMYLHQFNSFSQKISPRFIATQRGKSEAFLCRQIILKKTLSSVQSLSHVWLFATPWTAAPQASLSIANSQSLLKLMCIESVMPSNHLIFCHPLLFLPSIFPSIRVFLMSQFFPTDGQSIGVQLQHQSFQWIFRTDFL